MPNSKISIICDSSCDFSAVQASDCGFSMIPLTVSFEGETFVDGLEISPEQFFEKLQASKTLPKTSQPSPEKFMEVFRTHSSSDDIVCICVTGESSGTVRSAQIAADLLKEENFSANIHVVDSKNASCAIGLLAECASLMVNAGNTIQEILSRMEEMIHTTALYFFLDTLEYVRRGGRIGNIKAALGQALGIKPMLSFIKGSPTDVDKCRGIKQAMGKLVDKFMETSIDLSKITIVHTNAHERAEQLASMLSEKAGGIKVRIHSAGAIIGTYAGPGAIGIAFEEKAHRWA